MSDGPADGLPDGDGRLSDAEAFELVADETRARILRALGDATLERDGLPRLSYTELREAAGIRDSGRFNHHLQKLEGKWVTKHEDGYKLPMRGQLVYTALAAGSFTGDVTPNPFRLADRCPYCAHRLTARYTDDDVRLLVTCEFCGTGALNVYFPPNSLSAYDDKGLVDAAVRHSRMETGQLARGQCSRCAAGVDSELHVRDPTATLPWGMDRRALDAYVTYHCRECTGFHYTTVGEAASYHRRVREFCLVRGLDLDATRKWRHEWLITDRYATVERVEPPRVSVVVRVDPEDPEGGPWDVGADVDALRVTLGTDATVVATEEL